MAEINLLDSQAQSSAIKAQGKMWVLRIITAVFVVVILIYAGLLGYGWLLDRNITQAKATVAQTQSDITNNTKRQELLTRQAQLKKVNELIAAHRYWSPLLPELARVTLTSAKYTSITADAQGGLDLTVTVPSYSEAEKFLQVFDLPEYNKKFSDVKLMALSKAQQGDQLQTNMRVHLTVNPSLYTK